MAKAATSKVQLTNKGAGPRYVHLVGGESLLIKPGQTTDEVEILDADLADLPDGVKVGDGEEDQAELDGPGQGAEQKTGIPDDLANPQSNDGMIKRDDMIAIAKAAGLTLDGKETKADLLAKIVAARG